METHTPYAPPPALLERVRGGRPTLDLQTVNAAAVARVRKPLDPASLADLTDAYDAEVMAIDAALARLFSALERRGILGRATVVVTADHGEEFQEHGLLGHGGSLYEALVHVPLVVVTPDGGRGHVVERVVSLVDLAPTLLERAGVSIPASFEGRSFARLLDGGGWGAAARRSLGGLFETTPISSAYSERLAPANAAPGEAHAHARAVILGRKKLIVRRDGGRAFYALDEDPLEGDADGVGEPDRARLEGRLAELGARAARDPAPREIRPPGERREQALRGLGYLD
jgi:hypothetical protein